MTLRAMLGKLRSPNTPREKTKQKGKKSMKQRNEQVHFRITDKEKQQLISNAQKSGLSQSEYFRQLIKGYEPKVLPPIEYGEMIRLLSCSYNLFLERSDPIAAEQILNLVRQLTKSISPTKGESRGDH